MITNKGNIVVFDYTKCLVLNNGDPNTIVVESVRDQKNGLHQLLGSFYQVFLHHNMWKHV
jgi:hypothetical protein